MKYELSESFYKTPKSRVIDKFDNELYLNTRNKTTGSIRVIIYDKLTPLDRLMEAGLNIPEDYYERRVREENI